MHLLHLVYLLRKLWSNLHLLGILGEANRGKSFVEVTGMWTDAGQQR